MKKQFIEFIEKKKLFDKNDRVLLTVSGGVDSVVMCELFYQSKFNFGIAHCNFQLRGKESNEDEKFVKSLVEKYDVPLFTKKFFTEKYAAKNKISLQMAARDLRYRWFADIAFQHKFSFIATAHHLNDSIETFFVNLIRGTGIDGLTGVPLVSDNIIRPISFASKVEIEKFAKMNKIKFREDSSNAKDDYMRNKIRHRIIPLFEELNPSFIETMRDNLDHITFAKKLFREKLMDDIDPFLHRDGISPSINIEQLKKLPDAENYLFHTMSSSEFLVSYVSGLLDNILKAKTGNVFQAGGKKALVNRGMLVFSSEEDEEITEQIISECAKDIFFGRRKVVFRTIDLRKKKFSIPKDPSICCLDKDLMKYPLTLRKWQSGDYFYPLGMKGKKKISDYLVDEKINRFEKENICVLLSGNDIVCILGHRIDDRYKITGQTKKVLKIEMK